MGAAAVERQQRFLRVRMDCSIRIPLAGLGSLVAVVVERIAAPAVAAAVGIAVSYTPPASPAAAAVSYTLLVEPEPGLELAAA
jgi:hypothetical protein